MAVTTTQAIFLRRPLRRNERPSAEHFELVAAVPLPLPLQEGQLLVRNIYVSVDPYLFQYALLQPLSEPRQPIQSRAVGIVEESCEQSFAVGSFVFGSFKWATRSVVAVGATTTVTMADGSMRVVGGSDGLRAIQLPPTSSVSSPLPRYLGVLGMPGLAGYAGVVQILKPSQGSQVFISTAAGAVGLVAGQVAKLLGARVVGSTSTDEKCAFLLDHGFDAAINYRTAAPHGTEAELSIALKEHFPKGIDGFFDNVGGPMLDAVLGLANDHAAVAICGLISTLPSGSRTNDAPPPAASSSAAEDHTWQFRNFSRVLTKQLHIQGFQARNHFDLFDEYVSKMSGWLQDGSVVYSEEISQGIESLPSSLVSMLEGNNLGKQLVQVSHDVLQGGATAPKM